MFLLVSLRQPIGVRVFGKCFERGDGKAKFRLFNSPFCSFQDLPFMCVVLEIFTLCIFLHILVLICINNF